MYNIGCVLMHKTLGLIKISSVDDFGYNVVSINNSSSLNIPFSEEKDLRELIKIDEAEQIFKRMPLLVDKEIKNKEDRYNHYLNLGLYGKPIDLVMVIKRMYTRKKFPYGDPLTKEDDDLLTLASNKFHQEISYVYNISNEIVIDFITNKVNSYKTKKVL